LGGGGGYFMFKSAMPTTHGEFIQAKFIGL